MRVAVVCDWFLKYAVQQVVALQRHGLATALVCRDHVHEFGGFTAEWEAALRGAREEGVAVFVLRGRASSPRRLPQIVRLRKELRAWRPDLVHVHDNTDPGLLALCRGIPRVVTVHDPVPHPGAPARSRAKDEVRARWIRGASALAVHSPRLVRELAAVHPRAHIVVIPHGTEVVERPYDRPSRPRLLFFGRREPYKGLPVLLQAMQRVWTVCPDAQLAIHGGGSDGTGLPADPRVTSTDGYVSEAEVDRIFRDSSLLVLPYV